jgi:hypothetical protein
MREGLPLLVAGTRFQVSGFTFDFGYGCSLWSRARPAVAGLGSEFKIPDSQIAFGELVASLPGSMIQRFNDSMIQ